MVAKGREQDRVEAEMIEQSSANCEEDLRLIVVEGLYPGHWETTGESPGRLH